MTKLNIGIFFGGPSRERDLSLATAQQFYQQLDNNYFEVTFLLVDIHQRFIEVSEDTFLKTSIQDFFSEHELVISKGYRVHQESLSDLTELEQAVILQKLGIVVTLDQLPHRINLAFVDLGQASIEAPLLQQLVNRGIPFVGPAIAVRPLMDGYLNLAKGLNEHRILTFPTLQWQAAEERYPTKTIESFQDEFAGVIISPTKQRSLYARTIFTEKTTPDALNEAFADAQSNLVLDITHWTQLHPQEQQTFIQSLVDLQHGLGFPLEAKVDHQSIVFDHPRSLALFLNEYQKREGNAPVHLESLLASSDILIEPLIKGKIFNCILLQAEQKAPLALYPVFEGYKNGPSFSQLQLDLIRRKCATVAKALNLSTNIAIQGIFTPNDEIYIKSTKSIFSPDLQETVAQQLLILDWDHQQWSNFFIHTSLRQRVSEYADQYSFNALEAHLSNQFITTQQTKNPKTKIAILFTSSTLNKNAIRAAQYAHEQINGAKEYVTESYCLDLQGQVHHIPKSAWKDILEFGAHNWMEEQENTPPIVQEIYAKALTLTPKTFSQATTSRLAIPLDQLTVDWVLPYLQDRNRYLTSLEKLSKKQIKVGGSIMSTATFKNSQGKILLTLAQNEIRTIDHFYFPKKHFIEHQHELIHRLENLLPYPIAAVADETPDQTPFVLQNQQEIIAYAQLKFRPAGTIAKKARHTLGLQNEDIIPTVPAFLLKPALNLLSPSEL
ncbi:MAG: hypothetical protein AAF242_14260, partial [Bacteroidota bacterium]